MPVLTVSVVHEGIILDDLKALFSFESVNVVMYFLLKVHIT